MKKGKDLSFPFFCCSGTGSRTLWSAGETNFRANFVSLEIIEIVNNEDFFDFTAPRFRDVDDY